MNIEEKWLVLEKMVMEMVDKELSIEEREFAMARTLYTLGYMKEYYIGGKKDEE